MSSQKRGNSYNHYGDRDQYPNKKPRSNQPSYNSTSYDDRNRNRNGNGKPQQRSHHHQQPHTGDAHRLPELSPTEMQTGLAALLDRFVADETRPDADKDILYHARELRRLLCSRNDTVSTKLKRQLDEKRPDNGAKVVVPDYIQRKVQEAKDLPALPLITEPHIHEAVFTHQSLHATNLTIHQTINLGLDYERLEFLGDAYIELIASRALYNRFPQIDIPQLSSLRERLVENLTLGKFSLAYGFPDRLKYGKTAQWEKPSKAWNKVVADILEAYVAGVVLSDPDHGFETAEKWLTELWAPQLLGFKELIIENPRAKDDLQKLIFVNHIKVEYKEEQPMTYTNGVQRFYLGAYLTGWGYENEWLGSGEGQNKAQAAISAATDALKRNNIVLQDATRQKKELMEVRARERDDKAKAEASEKGEPSAGAEDATSSKRADDAEDVSPRKKSKKSKNEKTEKGKNGKRAVSIDQNS
jgi:ribonuclease-3